MPDPLIYFALLMLGTVFALVRLIFWVIGGPGSFQRWVVHGLLRRPRDVTSDIERTRMGQFAPSTPADITLLAGIGKGKAAPQTIADRTLRPTSGLRFITLGLGGLMLWLVWLGPEGIRMGSDVFGLLLSAFALYSIIHVQTYEARYDDYRLEYRGWFFQTRQVLWRDIASIRDDGAYIYVLRTHTGKKVEVQKYLVGITDFVAYALTRIADNKSD